MRAFGIDPANMFVFWDWVGGRYSLWSSIGLPIAIAVGFERFEQLLDGAHQVDEHFRTAPLDENLPITLGLLGVWYTDFLGAETHAVLPYDQYLRRLPAYLQQLDMESNGKRVDRGRPPRGRANRADRVGRARHERAARLLPVDSSGHAAHPLRLSDRRRVAQSAAAIITQRSIANCFAQSEALAFGKTEDEARAELARKAWRPTRSRGCCRTRCFLATGPRRPMAYRRLDPKTLGMLLALYEHKVFVMGAIWNINSFDQWGVELGKQLARRIRPELQTPAPVTTHDASTNALINFVKELWNRQIAGRARQGDIDTRRRP